MIADRQTHTHRQTRLSQYSALPYQGCSNKPIDCRRGLGRVQVLSVQQLVYIALQIARGLQQLHRRKLLHRDVAARNCWSVVRVSHYLMIALYGVNKGTPRSEQEAYSGSYFIVKD